jgi:hypothetical protein
MIHLRKAMTMNNKIRTDIKFTKRNKVGRPCTRRASYIIMPKTRTNYGQTTITFEGARLFNKIPSAVKHIDSFDIFKRQLAKFVNITTCYLRVHL